MRLRQEKDRLLSSLFEPKPMCVAMRTSPQSSVTVYSLLTLWHGSVCFQARSPFPRASLFMLMYCFHLSGAAGRVHDIS